MAHVTIPDTSPRVQYSVGGTSTTDFSIPFAYFEEGDIVVYVGSTLKTLTTDYTITGTAVDEGFSGGTVVLGTGVTNTTVTVYREVTKERLTDFPTNGPFNITQLNSELDRLTAATQEEQASHTLFLRVSEFDTFTDLTLPANADRAGTVLGFNATTGDPEAGPTIADVSSLAAITADISTLADIEDGTDATDAIQTVAGISSNVTTVAGISSDVTTVSGINSDVTAVAADATDIGTVSTNITNVNTVAGISGNVTTVAGISSDVTAVAADATDIGAVAAKATEIGRLGTADAVADLAILGTTDAVSDMNTLAAISTDIDTVAGISSNVTTVAGISSAVSSVAADATDIGTVSTNIANVNSVATNITNVNAVASNASNINAVAADATDIGTVSTNIANVNTVANISSNVTTVAGISADVTAVANISGDIQDVQDKLTEVQTVADDLQEAVSEIETVAASIANVNTVGTGIANVNTVAGISSNVTTVAGISANVTTVAGISGNVTTVAGISSDVTAVAADATDIGTVATNIANVNAVGGSIANVNTVATNLSSVNDFAQKYRIGATDPTTSLDEGDLFYNTTSDTLKVYNGSAWEAGVTAGSGFLATTGGSITGDVSFGDNDKAIFGAGSDLQIYHDGSNSYIKDAGTGHLQLWCNDLRISNANGSDSYLYANNGGALVLNYDGSQKLATTSTGINVTGTVTADGLTVDGDAEVVSSTTATNMSDPMLRVSGSSYTTSGVYGMGFHYTDDSTNITPTFIGYKLNSGSGNTNGHLVFGTREATTQGSVPLERMRIGHNGDISFYEDTGTTPKFFWDASAESLGIGTSSPARTLHISSATPILKLQDSDSTGSAIVSFVEFSDSANAQAGYVGYGGSGSSDFSIRNNLSGGELALVTNSSEAMRIDSSGNVGIGTASPSAKLHVEGSSAIIKLLESGGSEMRMAVTGSASYLGTYVNDPLIFTTNSTERMRIDTSGNLRVGVGNTFEPTLQFTNSGRVVGNPGYSFNGDLDTGMFNPSTQGTIAFANNGSESMRINSSGRVGIGTSSPVSKLDIRDAGANNGGILTLGTTTVTTGQGYGSIQFYKADTSGAGAGVTASIIATDGTGSGASSELVFSTGDTSTNNVERMRIDSDGRVGIGTNSPSTALDVNGTVNATAFTGDGSGLTGVDPFPSGTVMLFVQSAAPTGWTKSTTHNNKALRVVSGTVSSGGNAAFTTAFASYTPSGNVSVSGSVSMSGNIGSTTLSINQIPSHSHSFSASTSNSGASTLVDVKSNGDPGNRNTANAGGGGSHNHNHNLSGALTVNSSSFTGNAKDLAVQYVDVIIATKD